MALYWANLLAIVPTLGQCIPIYGIIFGRCTRSIVQHCANAYPYMALYRANVLAIVPTLGRFLMFVTIYALFMGYNKSNIE